MKHGAPRDCVCPWCSRLFADRIGVQQHVVAKHACNMPRTEEWRQQAALQTFHQERIARRPKEDDHEVS